jgi:hypothetical protein
MTPRLSDDLERDARRFDALGGRDLGLDEVLGRARGIRRRRRATVLVAAAAVAALIAVPASLTLRTGERTIDPARQLPTIDKISLSALPVGAEPRTGWLQGTTWHADGRTHALGSDLPGRVVDVAPIGDSLMAAVADDGGNLHAYRVQVTGDTRVAAGDLGAMTGGFARSAEGRLVAFAGTDGNVVTVRDGDTATLSGLPAPGPSATYDAVAVTGEDCSTGHQCAVWVNDNGQKPRVLTAVTPAMDLAPLTGMLQLADLASDGLVAGYTRIVDGGSCSRVQDSANQKLWRTCDARFLSFAPDGKHLLGSAAYADGLGDGELRTFDARTGRPGLDLRTAEGATITRMRWEDDDHVLATVYENNRWGVLRIGLDRTVEYAIAPVAGTDMESPFLLPE